MEPARKEQAWGTSQKPVPDKAPAEQESEVPEWESKLGKTIFYITVAASFWFFYWLSGIQCPC
jgi:hypothetical protein